MKFQCRSLFSLSALAIAAFAFSMPASARVGGPGHVYTMNNAATGNQVLVFQRGAQGSLTLAQTVDTHGNGNGAGLGSQGAVTLSQDGEWLFVVNAGSGTLSTLHVGDDGLSLASTVATGGTTPISVTEHGGVVYVLNAGVGGNIAGFRNDGGTLTALADGVRHLSETATDVGPAEVLFDKFGATVVVTEKITSRLTTYSAHADGTLSQPFVSVSAGTTPFGFVFDVSNHLLVSEAATSSLSSYKFGGSPAVVPKVISAAVPTGQLAACWAAVTPDGRFAFTANAASASLSTYKVARNGALSLSSTAPEATGAHPLDIAISDTGKRLFVLNTGNGTIGGFAIGQAGELSSLSATSVPTTAAGLAID